MSPAAAITGSPAVRAAAGRPLVAALAADVDGETKADEPYRQDGSTPASKMAPSSRVYRFCCPSERGCPGQTTRKMVVRNWKRNLSTILTVFSPPAHRERRWSCHRVEPGGGCTTSRATVRGGAGGAGRGRLDGGAGAGRKGAIGVRTSVPAADRAPSESWPSSSRRSAGSSSASPPLPRARQHEPARRHPGGDEGPWPCRSTSRLCLRARPQLRPRRRRRRPVQQLPAPTSPGASTATGCACSSRGTTSRSTNCSDGSPADYVAKDISTASTSCSRTTASGTSPTCGLRRPQLPAGPGPFGGTSRPLRRRGVDGYNVAECTRRPNTSERPTGSR